MPSWWQPQAEPVEALRHTVSHAVLPQLLRPMVAAAMPAPLLLDERDAVMCLTVLKCPETISNSGIGAVARLRLLQSLQIRGWHFDGAVLEYLTELRCLTHLNLTNCRGVNATTLRFVVDMPVLRTLQIGDCRSVDAAALAVAIKAPRLRNLEFGDYVMKDECYVAVAAAAAKLEALSVYKVRFTDSRTVSPLGALSALRILNFHECHGSHVSAILECAARMDHLHTLSFRNTCFYELRDFSGFDRLRDLKHLRRFAFDGPGSALAYVAPLVNLTSLEMSVNRLIVDDDLVHVAGLRRLEKFALGNCVGVSALGLRNLSNLHLLRDLSLTSSRYMDDSAVAIIAALRSIEILNLSGCNVDAATVAPLLVVPGLRHLDLTMCRLITAAEVAEMQWAAPRISFRHGTSRRPAEPFFSESVSTV